jgi:hypothetical protein
MLQVLVTMAVAAPDLAEDRYILNSRRRWPMAINSKQRIIPHLWFDKDAEEAAKFYTSIFSNSKITNISTIHEVPTPTGDCDIVSLLLGQALRRSEG